MIAPLAAHPGAHAVPREPSRITLFFRRAIAAVRRKPAAPEVQTTASGTAPALSPDDAWHGKTEPRGFPVLGDKMLSQVRAEQDAEPAAPAPWRPSSVMSTGEFRALDVQVDYWRAQPRRPVNGQVRPDQPRQAVPFSELNRKFSDGRPTPELLRQVLNGLKKLDVTG